MTGWDWAVLVTGALFAAGCVIVVAALLYVLVAEKLRDGGTR